MTRMDRILEIDSDNLLAVVQPGVINADLKKAVAEHGLSYPPDPSSFEFCSIGGNVANNSGGLCCVRYGVTRDYVLALEVVLADGTILRTGRRTLKGVAGYDLTALFVGSEGTLGVVTEVTVKLRPAPPPAATLVAFFPSMEEAGAAIVAIRQVLVPSMLELMDQLTVRAVEDWKHMGLDTTAAAMVVAQSDAGPLAAADVQLMADICARSGSSSVVRSTNDAEATMLVQARRLAIPAIEQRGTWLLDDIGVPCARIPDLLRRVARDRRRPADGDLQLRPRRRRQHAPHDGVRRSRPGCHARAEAALDDIVVAALDLGGTVTGEHGVGTLKRRHLGRELGAENLALQRRIKATLDPTGTLNPGKAL